MYGSVKGYKPKRSMFNLSYDKKFDMDMGQLIPCFQKMVVPGDVINLSQELVIRAPGSLAPYMAELNAHTYSFFVPLRILFGEMITDETLDDGTVFKHWEIHDHDFEKFISGGRTGKDNTVALPRWIPTGASVVNDNWNGIPSGSAGSNASHVNVTTTDNGRYSLWDYCEMPVGVIPAGAFPLDFVKRAYNLIWNEWFRDENVMPCVDVATSNKVLNCCWKKDYFTSALPWQQRGNPVALNMSGILPLQFASSPFPTNLPNSLGIDSNAVSDVSDTSSTIGGALGSYIKTQGGAVNSRKPMYVDVSNATTFDVSDLRLAFQIQKWQERNARGGARYVEFLKMHFGTSPNDDTLQRPMFIGGSKSPIIVSEVLQTSNGGEGVGALFGHTIGADANKITKFHVNEYGIILSLLTIKPKATYQQGIDREWLYRTRYDFFFPEFVNLSEQAVEVAELYASDNGNVDSDGKPIIFGYQGRYNELRSSSSKVCGGLRDSLSYWHMGRIFDSAPVLNGQFLKCNPRKDVFSVTNEPAFIVNVGNVCKAFRPLPLFAEPGFIDHN